MAQDVSKAIKCGVDQGSGMSANCTMVSTVH